ncbi:unnamed protein product [Albugo candida]|uniref:Uncharacterized protein n=1 Tax=Albugo candida TaxID=65357 RepID=A0A024GM45_9STRA|nr:unnamed protein product [Albugo candida]|eukprot:CCI47852.1 unnamed protein product [Albugo candida]
MDEENKSASFKNEGTSNHTKPPPSLHSQSLNSLVSAAREKMVSQGKRLLSPLSSGEFGISIDNLPKSGDKSLEADDPSLNGRHTIDSTKLRKDRKSEANDSENLARQVGQPILSDMHSGFSTQQRMLYLEQLIEFRRSDWQYLKKMHHGKNFWLNVALLGDNEVGSVKSGARRSLKLYYLGLGLGCFIGELKQSQHFIIDACQLLEELEFHFASNTVQGMKLMVATPSTLYERLDLKDTEREMIMPTEPIRPVIYKWNQRAAYRRLSIPSIPFTLDYREVVISVCEILAIVYSKMMEQNSSFENTFIFQAIVRFDGKLKKLVIDPIKKDYHALASQMIKSELSQVARANRSLSELQAPAMEM